MTERPEFKLPDFEFGPSYSISELLQKTGWDELDLKLHEGFGGEVEPRFLMGIADTGKANHVDIPEPEAAFNFIRGESVDDGNGHSTWLDGKIRAKNNDIGYRGICRQDTPTVILKVLSNRGSGFDMESPMKKFMEYWQNHPKRKSGQLKAAIYSMSYGGGGPSQSTSDLFSEMIKMNIIPVAAAGNSGRLGLDYPAGYRHTYAVGAYSKDRKKSGFTNYGPEVDYVAPGDRVYSTVLGNRYGPSSGTSMSCPIVAACLGRLISIRPNDSWIHNFYGLKEATNEYMVDLPGTWDGDGIFLPHRASKDSLYNIF